MSKIRGFSLEQIYSKESISRLNASKFIPQVDDMFVRATLASTPFFKRILQEFGQEGVREFIQTLQLKNVRDIDPDEAIWIHPVEDKLQNRRSFKVRQDSFRSTTSNNPQQNQSKRSRGLALLCTHSTYQRLKQRHEARVLSRKIYIMSGLPFFKGIKYQHLRTLCQLVQEKRFNRNMLVYRQHDPARNLFIVKEGTFEMKRYSEDRKKHKKVALLDNVNIFGEECLGNPVLEDNTAKYLCEVVCTSNGGSLLIIQRGLFAKFPLQHDMTLPMKISKMYEYRRNSALDRGFQTSLVVPEAMSPTKEVRATDHYEKLSRIRKKNPSQRVISEVFSDSDFFKKGQMTSMKRRLEYQGILDDVKMLKYVARAKINILSENKPKPFTRGVELEKKRLISNIEKIDRDKTPRVVPGKNIISALNSQAQMEPRHHRSLPRTTPTNPQLYSSQKTDNHSKRSNNFLAPISKNRSETNAYSLQAKNEVFNTLMKG